MELSCGSAIKSLTSGGRLVALERAEMPPLDNPRWEQFAQLIVKGLVNGDRKAYSQGRSYVAAGYQAKDAGKAGGSAEVCAARLLTKAQCISERVRELQAEANARLELKLDLSRERVGKRLDLASRMAESQGNPSAIAVNELGIAKVFGHIKADDSYNPTDLAQAKSMRDLAIRLLQSVGLSSPDDASISAAIEANDVFVERIEAIAA